MDPTATKWHKAIIADCERILARTLAEPERCFIESRGGLVALEMIHGHVKSLAGRPEELQRYLNASVE